MDPRFRQLVDALDDATDNVRFFRAPGRVNLIGDHTDYEEGFVLPVAIDVDCVVGVRPRDDEKIHVRSLDLHGEATLPADGSADPGTVEPPWARLAAGVAATLSERGRPPTGADLTVASTVPVGSGLASSAAFEVAVALALCHAAEFDLPATDLAIACQEAEHRATGVPCGVMDQLTAVAAVEGHALLVDCRTVTYEPVPLPHDLAILAVHSGVARSLTDTPYAERREHCRQVAEKLDVRSLRDATLDDVSSDPVAHHVVTENTRVRATALALVARDRGAIADLFAASHASLRDDFGCSIPELDEIVELLLAAGAVGARLTGAGWGGCVVALVPHEEIRRVAAAVDGLDSWVCHAAGAAGPLDP